jgi:hypothetical protein
MIPQDVKPLNPQKTLKSGQVDTAAVDAQTSKTWLMDARSTTR